MLATKLDFSYDFCIFEFLFLSKGQVPSFHSFIALGCVETGDMIKRLEVWVIRAGSIWGVCTRNRIKFLLEILGNHAL